MAKMKISELAEKLKNEGHNFESKDIIKALDELKKLYPERESTNVGSLFLL